MKRSRKGVLHTFEGIIAGLIIISFTSGAFHEPIDSNDWKLAKLQQESRELINAFDKANLTSLVFENRGEDIEGIIESILDDRVGISIKTIGIPRPTLKVGLLIGSDHAEAENMDKFFLKFKNNLSINIEGKNILTNINGRETLIHINTTTLEDNWDTFEVIILPVPLEFSDTNYESSALIQSNLTKIQNKEGKLLDFLQNGKGLILISNFVDEDCTKYDFIQNLFGIEWSQTLFDKYNTADQITSADTVVLNTIDPSYPSYRFSKIFQGTPIHTNTSNSISEKTTGTGIPLWKAEKSLANTDLKLGDAECVIEDCTSASPQYKNQQWISSKSDNFQFGKDIPLSKETYNIIVVDEEEAGIYNSIYIDLNQDKEFDSNFGVLNCSDITVAAGCADQLGCIWNDPDCEEDPQGATDCIDLDMTQCTIQDPCAWNFGTSECEGIVTVCSDASFQGVDNKEYCIAQKGCVYDLSSDTCKDLQEVTQCKGLSEIKCGTKTDDNQRGCKWNNNKCENDFQTAGCYTLNIAQCGNSTHTGTTGCAWNLKKDFCEPAGERFVKGDIIPANHGDFLLKEISPDGIYIILNIYENNRSLQMRPINSISPVYTTHPFENYGPIGKYNFDNNKRNNSQYILAHAEKEIDTCGGEKCPRYPAIIINYDETNGRTAWMPNNISTIDEWNILKSLILFTAPNEHNLIDKPHGKTNVVSINKIDIESKDMFQPYTIQFKMWSHV